MQCPFLCSQIFIPIFKIPLHICSQIYSNFKIPIFAVRLAA